MERRQARLLMLGGVVAERDDEVTALVGRSGLILAILAAADGVWLAWDQVAEEVSVARPLSRGAVHTAISRLRTSLGGIESGVIESGPSGYRLVVTSQTCDVVEFQMLCGLAVDAEAKGSHDEVLRLADRAERVWAGRPFEGVDGSSLVDAYRRSLENSRLELADTAAVAALATSKGNLSIRSLESVVAIEPLRETSSVLLAQCQGQAGHRVAALRTLQDLRRNLGDVGLQASLRVDEIEQELLILGDESESAVGETETTETNPFTTPSLEAAAHHLRAARYRAALREAERFIGQRFGTPGIELAEAWIICAMASHALMRPLAVRQAVTEAVKVALDDGSRGDVVRKALALAPLATAPNEPNQAIVSMLEAAELAESENVWAMAAIAANVACGAVSRSTMSAEALAVEALKRAGTGTDVESWVFAAECWLRVTEGRPGAQDQLRVASRCLTVLEPEAPNYAVVLVHRAQRSLRLGDRPRFEEDLDALERLSASNGMTEDLAISLQMRAALSAAEGDRGLASSSIETAARLTVDHPVHQEVGDIQRWWVDLEIDPERLLQGLVTFAPQGRSPAYRAMVMYTRLRAGDLAGASQDFDALVVMAGTGEPYDSAFPAAVAAMAEVAVALGLADWLAPIEKLLVPLAGELILGPGQCFVMGAADRFLGMLAAAAGRSGEAADAFERALRLEEHLSFHQLVRSTKNAAAQSL